MVQTKETILGKDVVIARLANSDKKAFERIKDNSKIESYCEAYLDAKLACCTDTGNIFDNKQELLLHLVERTKLITGLSDVFVEEKLKTEFPKSKYIITIEDLFNVCPVTGFNDNCKLTVHINHCEIMIEFGQLLTALDQFRFISILHEDFADFLKYFFCVIFKTNAIYVHLESAPVKSRITHKVVN